MTTTFRLVSGGQQVVLSDGVASRADPIWIVSYNLGYPAPRVVSYQYAGKSGKNDVTSLFDDRQVTLSLKIPGAGTLASREIIYDTLSTMCLPNNRPQLYVQKASYATERVMSLRADPLTNTVTNMAAAYYEVTLQFSCPSGLMDDTALTIVNVPVVDVPVGFGLTPYAWQPVGAAATVGLVMPSYAYTPDGVTGTRPVGTGFAMIAAPASATSIVTNAGSVATSPRMFVYGAASNPIIRNDTVGKKLDFSARGGLTIPTGQFLDIDVANRTVFMNSDPAQSYYSKINWTSSAWWDLVPGQNNIAYGGSAIDGNAQLVLNYTKHWV